MKFTIVFTTLLCISTSWGVLAKKVEDPKDKRETAVGYGSSGISAHSYQAPSLGQGDASAISVGAGYSIGGAKPSYSFGGQGSSGALQYSGEGLAQLSPNSHGTIQLAPITLQPSHGAFATGDLSQFMSQLSHSLGAGGLSLQPSTAVAEFHQGGEGVQAAQAGHGQEYAYPQLSYGSPKPQHFVLSDDLQQQLSNSPAYSSGGGKGLGNYATGPVLFTPSEAQSNAPANNYGAPSSGQLLSDAGSLSLGGGHSLGGSGHSLGGSSHSFGGAGHSFGGAGHSFGNGGHSLGGAGGLSFGGAGHSLAGLNLGGHSFGGSYKQLGSGYAGPGKTSFKPSAYLGSTIQGESGHALSSLSGSYGSPSFGSYRGASHGGLSLSSGGHSASFGGSQGGFGSGSSKYIAPVYHSAKAEGLEGASAFASSHGASPPGTTYGFPTSSYSSNNAHAASSNRPYYISKHHHHSSPSGFGEGSSSFKAPASSHSSLSSYSSGPKYSFGSSSSHYAPKDAHGAASETTYNTIKYSEELKPRAH
ncbi:unnamed protein product [Chrysodeixis includens]|uniref:Uncharacterized protein n=1 Tax=Chrysodeixis includens TaxID=689277 RepID=A0A9P0FXC0_CHRIL|nr:unnamed protein product [Chrysodeixis includens]